MLGDYPLERLGGLGRVPRGHLALAQQQRRLGGELEGPVLRQPAHLLLGAGVVLQAEKGDAQAVARDCGLLVRRIVFQESAVFIGGQIVHAASKEPAGGLVGAERRVGRGAAVGLRPGRVRSNQPDDEAGRGDPDVPMDVHGRNLRARLCVPDPHDLEQRISGFR
jgi:hypothetical protein